MFQALRPHLEATDRRPCTIETYPSDLRHFAAWFEDATGEKASPIAITTLDVRRYRDWVVAQGLKPSTVNCRLAALRNFLGWTVETGHIAHNPAERVHGIKAMDSLRQLDWRARYALLRQTEKCVQVAVQKLWAVARVL